MKFEIKQGIICDEWYAAFFKDYIEYWSSGYWEDLQLYRNHTDCYWMILE